MVSYRNRVSLRDPDIDTCPMRLSSIRCSHRTSTGKKLTMSLDKPNSGTSAAVAAVEFLAEEPGRIDRIRAKHYPLPGSDICAGCSAALTQHPCSATRIAELAMQRGGRP
jgi:hypothetical protein